MWPARVTFYNILIRKIIIFLSEYFYQKKIIRFLLINIVIKAGVKEEKRVICFFCTLLSILILLSSFIEQHSIDETLKFPHIV